MYSSDGRHFYGAMGEYAGRTKKSLGFEGSNLFVGDLVAYVTPDGENIHRGVIAKSDSGEFHIMGYWGHKLEDFTMIGKVLSHRLVTSDMLYYLHDMKIVEPRKMTIEEIEKELGYSVVIVKGDEDGERK